MTNKGMIIYFLLIEPILPTYSCLLNWVFFSFQIQSFKLPILFLDFRGQSFEWCWIEYPCSFLSLLLLIVLKLWPSSLREWILLFLGSDNWFLSFVKAITHKVNRFFSFALMLYVFVTFDLFSSYSVHVLLSAHTKSSSILLAISP